MTAQVVHAGAVLLTSARVIRRTLTEQEHQA